ncbi:gamma-glutamyltransferase [Corynebacterium sp. AOP40-9SA-29]|uniref:gamma-glutamyltransferase n=1 Tax=Corynebacterium sp. AOP40-9SA-29 TaxID=3457677 RepID=UPI004033AC55
MTYFRTTVTVLTAVGLLAACTGIDSGAGEAPGEAPGTTSPAIEDASFKAGQSCEDATQVSRSLSAKGTKDDAVVVTPDPYASDIACRTLADGGTAADAVAAAQFTLGLTEPQSSGPGGGAVAVYYDAASGETRTWNASVPAPQGDDGTGASGVPQTPQLMRTIQGAYGAKAFSDVLAPVAELADGGFRASKRFVGAVKRRHDVMTGMPWPGVSATNLPAAGDVLTNPSYADYLRGLKVSGRIASEDALCADYRGHDVCGSGSTGTGMMVVGEALGILDELELGADPRHVVTEAERLALTNGNTWMQDPTVDPELSRDYVDSLVTNPEHLKKQAARISADSTLGQIDPDPLEGDKGTYLPNREEGTSQITVRDGDGSMASVTSTLHQHFGSGELRNGFFMNNSMENFSTSAKATNQRAAGVRPKTAMTPVIVFRDGSPILAMGSPGGGAIPSYVIKTTVGILDRGMTTRRAIDADNYGAIGRDETYVEGAVTGDRTGTDSALSVVRVVGGSVFAEADERAGGSALCAR